MKRLLLGAVCAFALAGCASDYGAFDGPLGYNTWYDDAYGPYYGGYWDGDGFFYYRNSRRGPYIRDEGHHFQHNRGAGYRGVHAWRGRH